MEQERITIRDVEFVFWEQSFRLYIPETGDRSPVIWLKRKIDPSEIKELAEKIYEIVKMGEHLRAKKFSNVLSYLLES